MSYALRITRTAKELTAFWERLSGASLRLIVYEHQAARPHCHALVEGASVGTDSMKNWIKKALGVSTFPKTDWQFKAPTDNPLGFITYMSKGTLEPVYMKGFEPEQVNTLKGNWLTYATALRSHNPRKPEAPPLKWAEMLDIAEERLRKEPTAHIGINNLNLYISNLAIPIAKKVVYVENKAIVGRHKFRDFVDTLVARCGPGEAWQWSTEIFMGYR